VVTRWPVVIALAAACSGCVTFYRGTRAVDPESYRNALDETGATSPLELYLRHTFEQRPLALLSASPEASHRVLFEQVQSAPDGLEALAKSAIEGARFGADGVVVLAEQTSDAGVTVRSSAIRYGEPGALQYTGISCTNWFEVRTDERREAHDSVYSLATVSAVDGPAVAAGLQPDDVVLEWWVDAAAKHSGDCQALNESAQALQPGQRLELNVWRPAPTTQVMSNELRLDRLAGVTLKQADGRVVLGSLSEPARQSQLKAGDVLLAIDGHRVQTSAAAASRIREGGVRQVFLVQRKGVELSVPVETWGALFGLHFLNVRHGILVLSVKPEAEHFGLRSGDFLPIQRGWGQFTGVWDEWPGREKVSLTVVRQGQSRRLTLSPAVK